MPYDLSIVADQHPDDGVLRGPHEFREVRPPPRVRPLLALLRGAQDLRPRAGLRQVKGNHELHRAFEDPVLLLARFLRGVGNPPAPGGEALGLVVDEDGASRVLVINRPHASLGGRHAEYAEENHFPAPTNRQLIIVKSPGPCLSPQMSQ